MTENEMREIKEMAIYLDENCAGLFVLGYANPLPIVDFVAKLYSAGCRIIKGNDVVLSIGENNEALDEKTVEFFVKHNAEARKETARDILLKIYEWKDSHCTSEIMELIAKEYGLEVEE